MESNLIRMPDVRRMVGNVSEGTIYNWIKQRQFPRAGRLGGRVSIWNRRDVQRWIEKSLHTGA